MNKAFGYLGFAAKAGRVTSGEFLIEKAIKQKDAKLLLVAEDASDNAKKEMTFIAEKYNVPMRLYGTKEKLGKAIGKNLRACVLIFDEGLAEAVLHEIDGENTGKANR
ncbi:MAG: ribosomal L7Ae/L30e/S12e/Gadd45 family protein [Catonella sp.]|jgi:ribosomal protein L7Ae-like RNA K-turn-binding protein|nr:ribosomal L7Ae/L30e/S12e/Gadd45 family protein [Catonella sp.]MDY6355669.1 ribosomal L7Ae/L30e/S12e/Gadd45 family protein [Catonella sp.]